MNDGLNKIKNSKIYTSPFPHIAISNFFEENIVIKLHEELRENLKKETAIKTVKEIVKQETQLFGSYSLSQELLDANPNLKTSSKVNKFFNSKEFFSILINKLYGYIKAATELKKDYLEKIISDNSFSSELAFVPPSTSTKRREIHLDSSEVILGFLYYVKLPEDYSSGGSLNLLNREERYLFKSKFNSLLSDFLNVYPSDLTIEKTYDYEDNRLIVFCASGYSWHEVTTRRFANTPRITFHGSIINTGKNKELTHYDKNQTLSNPLKNKIKYILNLFK